MSLKKIGIVFSILVALSVLVGFGFKTDERYAKAKDLVQIAMRLDRKILEDRAFAIRIRLWQLEDRYGNISNMAQEIKDLFRRLKDELRRLDRKLEKLGN